MTVRMFFNYIPWSLKTIQISRLQLLVFEYFAFAAERYENDKLPF